MRHHVADMSGSPAEGIARQQPQLAPQRNVDGTTQPTVTGQASSARGGVYLDADVWRGAEAEDFGGHSEKV